MARLVGRTVAGVCAALLTLIALSSWLQPNGDVPAAAAHYLEQTFPPAGTESQWEVRAIEALPGRIRIQLGVNDGAAAGFLRMPDGARWLAFGPSCPAPGHPIWNRLGPDTDVELQPTSDAGETIMQGLSCRYWNRVVARR